MFSSNSSQVSDDKLFVEDCFSTFVYTGNGSTQTITNGINLSGQGGMVWTKSRTTASSNQLYDTARGAGNSLVSNSTIANQYLISTLSSFSSTGFVLGADDNSNGSGRSSVSWTFREAAKFFDVQTWTGTGANRTIAHNLGVAPGCILVKRTDTTGDWQVYHRSNANTQYMVLNTTAAVATGATRWNSTTPTATEFTVGTDATVNASGGTYVAYLFAHDATSDGIIQCGSFTSASDGSASISLGWEPQWFLFKRTDSTGPWQTLDTMRGFSQTNDAFLYPNTSGAESNVSGTYAFPTATGVQGAAGTFGISTQNIYVAIRRGPMRTPTTGTSVFSPQATTLNTGSNTVVSSGTAGPMDMVINQQRSASGGGGITQSRLTGGNYLITSSTAAETSSSYTNWDRMTDTKPLPWTDGQSVAVWQFKRAPSFMDEVCYTGTGSALTVNHNLGVAPEMMILKMRSSDPGYEDWFVYSKSISSTSNLTLNSNVADGSVTNVINTPTATTFSVLNIGSRSGKNYVSYLFASCPGVSKVFSFTGNGSSQTINCGFSGGARFILIKRTDSTGNWVVFDSARGIVSGNDPSLLLNSTAAETNYDDIDPDSSGFVVNQSTNNLNVNGATYIGLAIS